MSDPRSPLPAPTTPAAGISAQTCDGVGLVVRVTGALSVASRRELQQLVAAALERGERTVVLDLVEAGYVDTASLAALVVLAKRLTAQGGELRLVNASDDLLAILRLTELDSVFRIGPAVLPLRAGAPAPAAGQVAA